MADDRLSERAIFAGYLNKNFGHFLLESLSRLWITRSHPTMRLAWCWAQSYTAWQQEILDLLEVRNEPLFVARPTQFDSLLIPQTGFIIPSVFHPTHGEFLSVVPPSPRVAGRRCWLSRSKLPDEPSRVVNEAAIEEALADGGWTIVHPEMMSVSEVLGLVSSSDIVSGFIGSAFHALILLRGSHAHVKVIRTRVERDHGPAERAGIREYETIFGTKKFSHESILVEAEVHARGRFPWRDQLMLPSIADLLRQLQ